MNIFEEILWPQFVKIERISKLPLNEQVAAYQQYIYEWQVANAAWVKFWQWRDRAVQVGDNIDEMARNYFTYFF